MDHFTLEGYEIQEAGATKILVLATGNRQYKQVLTRAFPNQFLSRLFEDRHGRFEWGTYISKVDTADKAAIVAFLNLLSKRIYIDDDLTECFALDYHTVATPSRGFLRSDIGRLVYNAKPYDKAPTDGNCLAAAKLAMHMQAFIQKHPTYQQFDVIVSTPPSHPNKPFDLPTDIVRHILNADDTKVDGSSWVKKIRTTRPMKRCESIHEKYENVHQAFAVTDDADLVGRSVLVIDDIYESGFTINEVGQTLFEAGATTVLGLVATKTGRDMLI